MDIINLLPQIYNKFILFVLVSVRLSALFATFIMFKRELVNNRIMMALTAILAFYVVVLYPTVQQNYDLYSVLMLGHVLLEFLIGFIAGLILNIIFEIFVGVGQIISMQIGLSMASLIDPKFGHITSLTQFYTLLTMIIFLFLNGHLSVINTIIHSFQVLPIYQDFVPSSLMSSVFTYSSVMFSGAMMVSLTVIITILLANIALAVMTKFAPQINVFSIGINLTMIIGLVTVYLTFDVMVNFQQSYIISGLNFLQEAILKQGK